MKPKNLSIHFIGKIIQIFVSLTIIPFLIIKFDQNEFGILGIIWLILPILKRILNLGVDVPVSIKFFKLNIDDFRKHLGNSLLIIGLNTTFLISTSYLIWFFLDTQKIPDISSILIVISFCLFQSINNIWSSFLKNTGKVIQFELYQLAPKILNNLFAILAILFISKSVQSYLLGFAIGEFIVSIFSAYGLNKILKDWKIKYNKNIVMSLLKIGAPIIPGTIVYYFLAYGDRIILEYFLGLSAVAIYTLAYKLSEILMNLFITPSINYLEPAIMANPNQRSVKITQETLFKLISTIIIMGAIFLFAFGDSVFKILDKPEYSDSINISIILMIGLIINSKNLMMSIYLIFHERTKSILIINTVAGTLNIIINFMLIPVIGILGASISTIVAFIAQRVLVVQTLNNAYDNTKTLEKFTDLFECVLVIFLLFLSCFNGYNKHFNLYYIPEIVSLIIVVFLIIYSLRLYRNFKESNNRQSYA